ncbi:MAG: DUF5317 family protein [Bacillota bacterium]|nr:DUF5317 family protein [Bacillota bacterium]
MYLEALVLGLLIGILRKGRVGHFLSYPFKYRYMALAALFVFVLPYFLQVLKVPTAYEVFPFISMVILSLVVLLNHKTLGMKMLLAGLLLNLVIIGVNDFKMPIDTEKLAATGEAGVVFVNSLESGEILNYRPLTNAAGLSQLLGKVLALPSWYPFVRILSVGDILSSIGVVLILQQTMMTYRKGDMLHFTFRPGSRRY